MRFNAEGEVGAGDDVSPVASDGHFVASLFTNTHTHICNVVGLCCSQRITQKSTWLNTLDESRLGLFSS